MAATYKYEPLDLSKDAIRLVRLLKGGIADSIQCEIVQTFLHEIEGVPYEALSYTWGDGTKNHEITVNGQTALVTKNLLTALPYLRLQNQDRLLWIDSICINQEDKNEMGHQVGQMGLVYQNAERVLVWLGRSTDEVDRLMDAMNQIDARAMARHDSRAYPQEVWKHEWKKLFDHSGGLLSDVVRDLYTGMANLLGRPWFRRIWVIQEVARSRSAVVICGQKSTWTRTFALMPDLMGIKTDPGVQAILDIMPGPLRKFSWWSEQRDLHTLLKKFRRCEASDPRDKVYALLGVASDISDNQTLNPDYKLSAEEVAVQAMEFILFRRPLGPGLLPSCSLDLYLEDLDRALKLTLNNALAKKNKGLVVEMLARKDFNLGVNEPLVSGFLPIIVAAGGDGLFNDPIKLEQRELGKALRSKESLRDLLSPRNQVPLGNKAFRGTFLRNIAFRRNAFHGNSATASAELVRTLLELGADVNAVHEGVSALWASVENGDVEVARLLLKNGADADILTSGAFGSYWGKSVLWTSSERGDWALVELLLDQGASANATAFGSVSMALAADRGLPDHFLRRLEDMELTDEMSDKQVAISALWISAQKGYTEVVRLLLEHKANPNFTVGVKSIGWTRDVILETSPLYVAAIGGHARVTELLLAYGADPNFILPGTSISVLRVSLQMKHTTVANVLLRHGAKARSSDGTPNQVLSRH